MIPVLSICMMVRDEEDNLERCLSSIKSVIELEQVELIIVDTGSTDSTVEIAKKYTNKVYFHTWNHHFSEMRNITLSYAKGKWVFIYDADEKVSDSDKLIELIKLEKLEHYNTVQMKVRNYTGPNKDTFMMASSLRMFKNKKELKYEGSVHNQPIYQEPILNTDIYIEHYGYLLHDEKLMENKFTRTATLLIKELEKNPHHIYYRFQLATSYSMYGRPDKAQDEIKKAYKELKILPKREKLLYIYIYIYASYANHSYVNNNYNEAISACQEAIELQKDYIDLYYIIGLSLYKINNHKDAIIHFRNFLELYDAYEETLVSKNPSIKTYHSDPSSFDTICTYLVNSLKKIEKFEEALSYTEKIINNSKREITKVELYIKLNNVSELYHLVKNNKFSDHKQKILLEIERCRELLLPEEKRVLEKQIMTWDNDYGLFYRIQQDKQSLGKIKEIDFNKNPVFFAKLLKNFESDPRGLLTILNKVNTAKIKSLVQYLLITQPDLKIFLINYLKNNSIRENDLSGNRIYMAIASALVYQYAFSISDGDEVEIDKQYLDLFENFIKKGYCYLKLIYKEEKFRLIYQTFENKEHQLIILLNFVEIAIIKKQYNQVIKFLTEAVEICPEYVKILTKYKESKVELLEL